MKLKPQTIRKAVAPKTDKYSEYARRNMTYVFSTKISEYLGKSSITRKAPNLF